MNIRISGLASSVAHSPVYHLHMMCDVVLMGCTATNKAAFYFYYYLSHGTFLYILLLFTLQTLVYCLFIKC